MFTTTNQPPRRGRGRPVSAATVRRSILQALGPDHGQLVRQIGDMARAGDPSAQIAAATLLAAALAEPQGTHAPAPADA